MKECCLYTYNKFWGIFLKKNKVKDDVLIYFFMFWKLFITHAHLVNYIGIERLA